MDFGGPFGWSKCTAEQASKVFKFFADIETMRWSELPTEKHHEIPIGALSKEAKKRLLHINQDTDEVFSLRVASRERMIDIRDRDVFSILWWDPEHLVCPSNKKHT